MKIKILKRDESLKIINDENFVSRWKTLADESKEFTLIQEHDFVTSWYNSYKNQYDPVMVIGYDKDENIIAILPLAICKDSGKISHAGDGQAEYNSWICKKENEEEFLVESLINLKKEFNLVKWDWGWMPPNASNNWLHSEKLKKNGIYINVGTFESPRYDLSDLTRITKIKKSKSIRSNTNRLKRSGDLKIERITDVATAKKIFVELKKIYNFRNLAVYNNMAFESDNCKEQWHLNHLENSNDSVHFTVLWQGDKLLACNFGFCSDTTVMMGLFAYNPVQGARSPGNIFLIMLTEFIAEEGFQYLDLTPGGDPYKERFCNAHVTLTKPIIFFKKWTSYKNNSVIYLKNKIKEKYSYRDIIKFKGQVNSKLKKTFSNLSNNIAGNEDVLLECSPTKIKKLDKLDIGIQKYGDLLLYKENSGFKRKKDVVFVALKNFERDDHLYTLVQNNVLTMYAWVSDSKRKHMDEKINVLINITEESPFIYDCYLSKDTNEEEASNFIMNIINHYAEAEKAYLLKPPLISKDHMIKIGFTEYKHEEAIAS